MLMLRRCYCTFFVLGLVLLLATRARVILSAAPDHDHHEGEGDTELTIRRGLESRLPQLFLDTFDIHIISSSLSSRALVRLLQHLPNNTQKKRHILWLHTLPEEAAPDDNSPQQRLPLHDPKFREQFTLIVFVSDWQKRRYEDSYQLDFNSVKNQAVVLRPAIRPFRHTDSQRHKPHNNNSKEGQPPQPIRLIYHTTPHRGLQLLIPVFFELYKRHGEKIHLDVYSSVAASDDGSKKQRDDAPSVALFDQCRNHPGCTYHGMVSHEKIRDALIQAHIFAYPNIGSPETTSCVAAMEAMSAGCEIVTSQHDNGALRETLNGFGWTYPFTEDLAEHAMAFIQTLHTAILTFWDPKNVLRRRQMSLFAAEAYDWGVAGWTAGGRIEQWLQLLTIQMSQFDNLHQIHRADFDSTARFSEALFVCAKRQQLRGNTNAAREIYLKALQANPRSSVVSIALGLLEINVPDTEQVGMARLEAALAPSSNLLPPLEDNSIVTYGTDIRVAYLYSGKQYEKEARDALESAFVSQYPHDDCFELYRASYMAHVPMTQEEERNNVAHYHTRLDDLIIRAERESLICDNIGSMSSPFSLAYYDLDFRDELEKWTRLYMLVFRAQLGLEQQSVPSSLIELKNNEALVERRRIVDSSTHKESSPLRIGFVSSFFKPTSSIWGSFGKTINYLQSNPLFNVDLIYYPTKPIDNADKVLSLNPETNLYLSPFQNDPANRGRAREGIVARRYDILVYLDLWMNIEMNQLAVAKLAPIQMVTHGHPVTSGIPPTIMDYFISWKSAELPDPKAAQAFYTEELILLDPGGGTTPWEYYEPRTYKNKSLISGQDFSHYTRESLAEAILVHDKKARALFRDPSSVLYFCAQAPFKFYLTFDTILSEIQRLDPNAVIVLIELEGELSYIHTKIKQRLGGGGGTNSIGGGVDMSRVVFIPRMNHHHLMAMYQNADVVLDSFYFGGDTTSREAFETGAPIITLPHKTIGQRWTQAYYEMMGIDDYIARDTNHYAHLAVGAATLNPDAKIKVRERIKRLAHENLFRCTDGVISWADMFVEVATRPRRWRWVDEKVVQQQKSAEGILIRDEL